jgi:hypothetical protein
MDYNFNELMSKKTDDELITILLVQQNEYSEAALHAAREEFNKRGISNEKIDQVHKEAAEVRKQQLIRANEPLEQDVKNLAMFFPLVANILNAEKFRKEGYERKSAELSRACMNGRFIYIGIIVLIIILVKCI